MKVFITRILHSTAKELLSKHFEVDENKANAPLSKKELSCVCHEYDAVLSTCADKIDFSIMKSTTSLKLISNYAVGLDNIDINAAKDYNIKVFNTPDVVTNSTADHTLALILGITRKIYQGINFVKENQWKAWDPHLLLGNEISNMTVGIIGYGRIGQAVAKRVVGFTSKILFYDANILSDSTGTATFCEIEALLAKSDIITIHAPGGKANRHLIQDKAFQIIEHAKRYPYLINTARGEIICSKSLEQALTNKIISGAALDVVENEPINSNHPLLQHNNCIITPHIGTATINTRIMMAQLAAQNIIDNL